jgi:hypothetical protein
MLFGSLCGDLNHDFGDATFGQTADKLFAHRAARTEQLGQAFTEDWLNKRVARGQF